MKWIRPALAAATIAASGIGHAHGDESPAKEAGAARKERGTVGVAPGTSRENAIVVAQADTTMTDGEVRKIDKDNRKITLRHGEIRNLDMPAMTMVYQVKDRALLERVKQGDKVRFHAEQVNGAIVITALEPMR